MREPATRFFQFFLSPKVMQMPFQEFPNFDQARFREVHDLRCEEVPMLSLRFKI